MYTLLQLQTLVVINSLHVHVHIHVHVYNSQKGVILIRFHILCENGVQVLGEPPYQEAFGQLPDP